MAHLGLHPPALSGQRHALPAQPRSSILLGSSLPAPVALPCRADQATTATTCRRQSAAVDADTQQAAETSGQASPLDGVRLDSEAGVSYDLLKQHLAAGKFQDADNETRAKLIQLAGKDAQKRGWVYFSEVQFIPVSDLQILDNLWRAASGDLFGYAAQKEVWQQNRRYWTPFFKAIKWVQGERNDYRKWPGEFIYSLEAPQGHLPLTNALRGTQLFQAIMEHPAFAQADKPKPSYSNGNGKSSSGNSASNLADLF